MAKYEMLYMINNDLSDEAKNAEAAKYENIVTSFGGTVVSTEKQGTKKLSYPVKFKNEAFYVLMTFECDGSVCAELTRISNISADTLRSIITKIDD